jgi:hypothetical protein
MQKFLAKSLGFCLLFILSLEVYSISLPATSYPPTIRNEEFGFDNLDPIVAKRGTFTFGRTAQIRADWHINSEGWNSLTQYSDQADDSRLLVTLSGDSYVNSLYHGDSTQITGFLKAYLPAAAEVYGFGMPGTNMADYWRFGCYYKKFKPDICLYLINSGDVAGALAELARNSKASQVQLDDKGLRFLPREIDRLEIYKRLLRRSKAWTFLNQNFDLTNETIAVVNKIRAIASLSLFAPAPTPKPSPASIDSTIASLVDDIVLQTPNSRHIFLLHPNRESIYRTAGNECELEPDLKQLENALSNHPKAEVLNLSPIFAREYRRNSRKFEFEINRHFNAYGNSVVAQAIADHLGLPHPSN